FAKRAKSYNDERGPGRSMHVFCCEKHPGNYKALAANLEPYSPDHAEAFKGSFELHVQSIAATLKDAPALILVDPIGPASIPAEAWKELRERNGKTDIFVVLVFSGL